MFFFIFILLLFIECGVLGPASYITLILTKPSII